MPVPYRSRMAIALCHVACLVAGARGATLPAAAPAPANLLPNSSFEAGAEPREIYPIIGEYRHTAGSAWQLDSTEKFHGARSLRMAGTTPFFWQVLSLNSLTNVFSAYMKGARPGLQVELGMEDLSFIDDGAVCVEGGQTKVVTLTGDWARYELGGVAAPKREYLQFHLFRAWVRPLAPDSLWLDAAQFEKGTTQAGAYQPERGDNTMPRHARGNKPLIYGPEELEIRRPATAKTGQVAFVVREPAGRARENEPVWGGIPFPRGELFDEQAVRLHDERGQPVPCQTRALARYHIDGSITSLLLDFQASLPANGSRRFVLHYGQTGAAAAGGDLAADAGGEIRLDTGAAKAVVRKDAFRWFDTLEAGGRQVAVAADQVGAFATGIDGRVYASHAGPPDEVRVESNGRLHAVILVRGRHHAVGTSGTLLNYEARIHAFAGKPYFLLESTFENREPFLNATVGSIFIRLPRGGEAAAPCRLAIVGGPDLEATVPSGGRAAFTQLHNYFGLGRYDVAVEVGGLDAPPAVRRGVRGTGRFVAGPTRLAMHDFVELNPKAFAADAQTVALYHWPARHVRWLDLPFGMANTIRLAYCPLGGEDDGAALAQAPMLVQPDPAWLKATGVFTPFLTAAEAERYCPRFERRVRALFAGLARDREVMDLTGLFDYGDAGTPLDWMNNETTFVRNLWIQYLRTGEPALFRRASSMARHLREVDICHAGDGARFMHHPSGGFHTTYGWHTGHYWITGLIWHYLLTGDARTFNVVRDVGAELMLKYRASHYTGRERGRMLEHLAELYDLTHLKCFRVAFETQYGFGQPTPGGGYYGGNGLMLLERWHQTTGDPQPIERLKADTRTMVGRHLEHYVPGSGVGHGRGWYIFTGMAAGYRAGGDRRCLDAYQDQLVWYTVSADSFDHNAVRALEFLDLARQVGIPEPPMMPDASLGTEILLGFGATRAPEGEPALRMRVADRADVAFAVKVYRARGFRKKGTAHELAYRLRRPDGAMLKEEILGGVEPSLWRELRVEPDGLRGDYLLDIESRNDGQGLVSCTLPTTFLDARRDFGFRYNRERCAFVRYALRAPLKGSRIGLRLDWKDRPGHNGRTAGVWLEDTAGRLLARQRWATPLGTVYDETGRQLALPDPDVLPLEFPDRLRGQPLVITIWSPKWTHFRIEGLDEPWLAATPAAFEE
ncbi:MAG: hypothetical protein JXR37_01390 [Kiritimatiellae bacterium]|nr:hypothetical protein [Kiritimatiellia bacterium]